MYTDSLHVRSRHQKQKKLFGVSGGIVKLKIEIKEYEITKRERNTHSELREIWRILPKNSSPCLITNVYSLTTLCASMVEKVKTDEKAIPVVDVDEKEDDWLPPPPKVSSDAHRKIGEDSTLKELRLKKQELESVAQSAKDMLQTVEESAKRELDNSLLSSFDAVTEKTSKPPSERVKIVISIQDKDGLKQFRVYMDDNFERIFKMYADKVKLDLKHLVFSFDGDRISPSQTPSVLGMEDDDIIEVHVKSS
ncbi:Rad60/SUMO-like domain containing protein [Senna tora]|uniref:Rad60/SUMO-like domain containing protein n=1 Tax=Senna tora TaxID=362788 RepID=A0A834W521_9FABA|nr:Rad60/SUMO-like domain containing protein [Senna tora]